MRSLVVDKAGMLSITDIPEPNIMPYQALVKMEACGICNGTDMKLIHGTFKNFTSYPAILGHEGVGRVIKTGSAVSSFKIGDRVLLPFLEENAGDFYPGWGAFSEYAVVGDKELSSNESYHAQNIIPEEISSTDAVMIVTFREVLSAIKRYGMKENRSIIIYGAGPVGLCFIRFCKLLGLYPVIAVDITDEKVDEAAKMGADYTINSSCKSVKETVRGMMPDGVDYVVDAVGINDIINQAMELIKYNGQICCYGISSKLNMNLDWSKAPYNWSLNFVQWPSKLEEGEAHTQVMNWIKLGVLTPTDFISDIIGFDDVVSAFKKVEDRTAKKKIVIKFS